MRNTYIFHITWICMAILLSFAIRVEAAYVVVSPDNLNGWVEGAESGAAGAGAFVTGPGTAPAGAGSFQITLGDGASGYGIGTQNYANTRLDAITTLSYATYQDNGGTQAISFQFSVDYDLTDGNTAWQGRLIYEPYNDPNNTVTPGTWQTWNAIAPSARWWASGAPGNGTCGIATPCTIATLLTTYPNMGISGIGQIILKAGAGWPGFSGYVDNLMIQGDTFDFEPLVPNLTISKSGPTDVLPGSTFNYTVTVNNTGNGPATNVILNDPLPPEVTYISDDQGCGAGITCNIPILAAGTTYTVVITVQAQNTAGATASNTANVSSDQTALISSNTVTTTFSTVPTSTPIPIPTNIPVVTGPTPTPTYSPPPPTCNIMNDDAFSAGNISDGIYCRVLMRDGRNQAEPGAVPQGLIDNGVILALDVFHLVGGTSISTFPAPIQICISGTGRMIFRDAVQSPRQNHLLDSVVTNGQTCSWIVGPGTLVLIEPD